MAKKARKVRWKNLDVQDALEKALRQKYPQLADRFALVEAESEPKYVNWFLEAVPSFDDVKRMQCLICYLEEQQVHLHRFVHTGNLQGHLRGSHKEVYDNDPDAVKRVKDMINAVIFEKKILIKKENLTSKRKTQTSTITGIRKNLNSVKLIKYLEAIWCLTKGRPDFLVNDEPYRKIKKFLHSQAPVNDRMTINRAQTVVYGYVFDEIQKRIAMSARYFRGRSFITIQGDAWTSQANKTFFGVSASYYD